MEDSKKYTNPIKVETYLVGFNIYNKRGTIMNAVIGTKTPGQQQVFIHKTLNSDQAKVLYDILRDESLDSQ